MDVVVSIIALVDHLCHVLLIRCREHRTARLGEIASFSLALADLAAE